MKNDWPKPSQFNDALSHVSRINRASTFCCQTFLKRWDGKMKPGLRSLRFRAFAHWRKRCQLDLFNEFARTSRATAHLASPVFTSHVTVFGVQIFVLGAGA